MQNIRKTWLISQNLYNLKKSQPHRMFQFDKLSSWPGIYLRKLIRNTCADDSGGLFGRLVQLLVIECSLTAGALLQTVVWTPLLWSALVVQSRSRFIEPACRRGLPLG